MASRLLRAAWCQNDQFETPCANLASSSSLLHLEYYLGSLAIHRLSIDSLFLCLQMKVESSATRQSSCLWPSLVALSWQCYRNDHGTLTILYLIMNSSIGHYHSTCWLGLMRKYIVCLVLALAHSSDSLEETKIQFWSPPLYLIRLLFLHRQADSRKRAMCALTDSNLSWV